MKFLLHSFCILCLLFFADCKNQSQYTEKAAKSLINTENDLLEINEVIFHNNDSTSVVYLEIKNENLLYKYTDTAQLPYARLKIAYTLVHPEKQKQIMDSGHYFISDRAEQEILSSKSIYSMFTLPAVNGQNYRLELSVIDLNKRIQYAKAVAVQKKDLLNRQNFLVMKKSAIQFSNVYKVADTLQVKLNSGVYFNVWVDYFKKTFPIAPPPFSTKAETESAPQTDSTFSLPVSSEVLTVKMPEQGFYHVRLSEKSAKGLSLFTFSSSFPGITDALEMIQCTRYIMNREEFTHCLEAQNKKAAIDKFWLEIGGSNERARELLKRYYARVKEANTLYTSYKEGWKTDRGMIFIVFGQPSNIVQKNDGEVWTYGSAVNQTSTTFIFKKIENPFSNNLFVLERSQLYKSSWSNAVDLWRQGIYYEGRR